MKVKHFSHTDLDGIGGVLLSIQAFGAENVDYVLCENETANDTIRDFCDRYSVGDEPHYDLIVVTDLVLNAFEASWLEGTIRQYDGKTEILHFDHHDVPWLKDVTHGANFVSMYDWSIIQKEKTYPDGKTIPVCGTSLWYDRLVEMGKLDAANTNIYEFVDMVRQWDTWEWAKVNNLVPRDINRLLYLIGTEKFMTRFGISMNAQVNDHERMILEIESNRVANYVAKKLKQVSIVQTGSGLKAAVVYAEDCFSELGHEVSKAYPETHFSLIINPGNGKMSLRTERDDVNLGELANKVGGGGREQTAGAPTAKVLTQIVDLSLM